MLASILSSYKNAYSGLSKHSWYLALVLLVNRSGTMVIPFMTIYCTQKLHFSIAQAGVIMSMFGVGSLVGAFMGGRITDKYGFYDVQLGALLSGGVLFLILGFQQNFWWICAISFLLSSCNDAFRPANSTAVAHYSNADNRTRSYSLNRLAVNLGWACGGALGGVLASVNYHLLFWVDGFTNIFSAVLLLRLMPRAEAVKSLAQKVKSKLPATSAFKDGIYLWFSLFNVLFAVCFFQLFTMQPVFYKTEWHFSERFIGWLMSLNGLLIIVIEMVLVHKLDGRRHPLIFIATGVIVTGVGFMLTNILPAGVVTAYLIVFFVTLGEILSMPFMNTFWLSRSNSENTGQYAGIYSMAWSAAQILAPTLGSQLIAYNGYALLWWVLGGICLLSATGYFVLYSLNFKNRIRTNATLVAR